MVKVHGKAAANALERIVIGRNRSAVPSNRVNPLYTKRIDQITAGGSPKALRSEEHTSELQSLMRISYAVFCLKTKTHTKNQTSTPPYDYSPYNRITYLLAQPTTT